MHSLLDFSNPFSAGGCKAGKERVYECINTLPTRLALRATPTLVLQVLLQERLGIFMLLLNSAPLATLYRRESLRVEARAQPLALRREALSGRLLFVALCRRESPCLALQLRRGTARSEALSGLGPSTNVPLETIWRQDAACYWARS